MGTRLLNPGTKGIGKEIRNYSAIETWIFSALGQSSKLWNYLLREEEKASPMETKNLPILTEWKRWISTTSSGKTLTMNPAGRKLKRDFQPNPEVELREPNAIPLAGICSNSVFHRVVFSSHEQPPRNSPSPQKSLEIELPVNKFYIL
jgi:hypothetical protein